MRKIMKSLFEEAQEAMAAPAPAPAPPQQQPPSDGLKSPYDVSNQEALAKELSNINKVTEELSNQIIDAYKKNEFSLKIGMGGEPNFDRFAVLIQNTLALNEVFADAPEVQKRLARLISLAYYHAQSDPGKRFKVYKDKVICKQVTEAIYNSLVKGLKMTFLTYDTEFQGLVKKVIFKTVNYDKSKKA